MKALKINTETRTIEEIFIDGSLKSIYDAIGNGCTCFECPVSFENDDTLYVDEEGLFHDVNGGMAVKGFGNPIVGNGLIIGTDIETGESRDCLSTVEEIKSKIKWISKEDANMYADYFR